ncbi:MAG: 2-hydroxyacyl-CoA dehydratase [Desulfomonile tiedjei]|uniref:2-hydroxyacyl-CoA dehydratase n=1 Tax=Desulfomonile tiedjei TaxID=2358 RepID=A0A9D6V0J0_9BACT|nr:2-hydroxyacyl-CoA dehydratase [Desulfomonile tiedjei]
MESEEDIKMEGQFRELIVRQREMADEWKSAGGKVVGHFCNYVPEEILHAGGVLSIRILGSHGHIARADAHVQTYVCKLIRSSLDMGLVGELDYLDGVIIPYTCDGMRLLFDLWTKNVKQGFVHLLDLPLIVKGDIGRNRFEGAVIQLKKSLEDYLGKSISEEALSISIRVYNENRALLRELYNLRRNVGGMISNIESLEAVLSSLTSPKELHSDLLRRTILERSKSTAHDEAAPGAPMVRLHVSGSLVTDSRYYQIIEDCGGLVVSDDLCTGTRYYWDDVKEDTHPLKAITNRYLDKLPCPCKSPSEERYQFVLDSLRQDDVQGVIFVLERYCDPHLYDYPFLRKKVESMGIPVLQIDAELGLSGVEQLRTRIQAFIEIVRGG